MDAAYSRYAFLKELERRKEEQKHCEQILRGEDVEESTNERLFEDIVESDTSSTSDIDEQWIKLTVFPISVDSKWPF